MKTKLSLHTFKAGPGGLFGTPTPARAADSKPHELSDADFLPQLSKMRDDELIVVTQRQLSAMSTVACGSVSLRLGEANLQPAIFRSNVYRVRDIRLFCGKHAAETAEKLKLARHALGTPPPPKVQKYHKKTVLK